MPSKSAKTPVYFNHQNGAAPILDGRYADDRTPLALPVEIYHPVFAKFYARSRDETLDPPPDLVVETSNFMVYSSKIQTQEVLRQYTRTHLSKLLSIVVDLHINDNGTRPNHSITYDRETEPMVRVSLAIVEEKAELGQSGEPTVQASFSYIEHWNQPDRLVGVSILQYCCFH